MRALRLAAAGLGLCLLPGGISRLDSAGLSGKYPVRDVEYALDLRPPGSRARITLGGGQTLDLPLDDRESADRLLGMMSAVAQGAQMAARVEDGEVRSLFLVVEGRAR
jgi:hypothetical protein